MDDNFKEMYVTKRNGHLELISFDKILLRIKKIGQETGIQINYQSLAMKVIDQLYDKIDTMKIDEFAAEQCAILSTIHPDYAIFASKIIISNHQKNTDNTFSSVINKLYNFKNIHGVNKPLVNKSFYEFVKKFKKEINSMIDYNRDYLIDYFGFKTLEKSYLCRIDNKVVERPQHMWMRVAIAIHGNIHDSNSLDLIKETYDLMSSKYFTHATPTLFNAGTPNSQLSSCYLIAMENDSIEGIYNTLKDCALISKYSGGIGLHIHNIRAKGSHIQGTNGVTDGLVPMLKVFNSTARYVNQCFTPDTWVYSDSGPKQMCEITTDDKLVTIDGTFKRVNQIIKNEVNKEILEISTIHTVLPVKVTNEHQIFTIKNPNLLDFDELKEKVKMGIMIPDYYSAATLTEYDLVAYPLPIFEENSSFKELNDIEHIKFVGSIIGLNSFHDDIDNFIHLPDFKLKYFFEELIKNNCCYDITCQLYTTENINIIMVLKFLLLKLGLLTKSYFNTHTKKYSLNIPSNLLNNNNSYFQHNNMLWGKITKIKTIQYSGEVYDFNMIDNHNYLTDMGIVHNSGRRNGSFAIYLEPWHADIEAFLELKKNHGDEDSKARDLFYALWTNDLFMERIEKNLTWSLFCPNECPGLADVYGDKFTELYTKYETLGLSKKVIKARDLWLKILDAQMETGTPYILYKDACNLKSNQQNLGTIKSSNLCCEIIQYSDTDETAVCNLASIALPTFVNQETKQFDYDKLHYVTKVVTNNLNKVIDINFYPTEKTQVSNMRHRPIGIGVQGLADTFILMDLAFQSDEAREVNKLIFETIYHASLEKSNEISLERFKQIELHLTNKDKLNIDKLISFYEQPLLNNYIDYNSTRVGAYSSFNGSPASNGILQFDMWGVTPSNRYDWATLKQNIKDFGLRNSLLVAPMPTASTSQILGFNECFEPFTSNLYSRRTLAGEFIIINKYLIKELIQLGRWNEDIKNNIIANKGSIQHLDFLPEHTRNKYKIVWEIPMKYLIDLAADRGAFICQSQSLNLWIEDPTYNILTSMHFYSWKKGLKTGIYYLRRKAKHQAQQFTIEPKEIEETENTENDICENCSA